MLQHKVFSGIPWLEAANAAGKNSGIIIDILDALKAADASFDYHLTQQTDGVYGDVYPNGTTTGLINQVVTGVRCIKTTRF